MARVVMRWAGGEHAVRLGIAEAEVIQQHTDCGPEFLLNRISLGQWELPHLMEVIRNGLIGGGMDEVDAKRLVDRVVAQQPWIALKRPAMEILSLALYGPPDDPVGEGLPAGDQTQEPSLAESGSSAPITG
ncbi:tail tube GTA-gp10-like protein [Paracoccus pantotrophus]|uniref:Gene transfer agent family protein n=1 Tax=Paracoccus pantotrophus TaxID=82367 RepID=A0AAE6TSB3_PARPN|nr:gene transfer agent family protein [Paracoccus pantotrophus]QFG35323.1 gene transfer agent family protein [Paracoccus pantotrophus]RKS44480.1 tail tube GTA-gp10-like protein [Paracoccus pantotrophus]